MVRLLFAEVQVLSHITLKSHVKVSSMAKLPTQSGLALVALAPGNRHRNLLLPALSCGMAPHDPGPVVGASPPRPAKPGLRARWT